MQMAAALVEELRRHLAGEAQYRLVAAECGQHRCARVEHARLAGGARITIGHVAAGLLMPRADHLELRLMERIEQTVDLCAGQAEHGVDAVRDDGADDCFAAGHGSHGSSPYRFSSATGL